MIFPTIVSSLRITVWNESWSFDNVWIGGFILVPAYLNLRTVHVT